jgi:hypothetical protein
MLFAAGDLTMELAEQALTESFGLKDASPLRIPTKSMERSEGKSIRIPG